MAWKIQEWEDEDLYWDPDEYDGEDHIHVEDDKIWTPDTYLYNTLEMVEEDYEREMPITITTNKTKKTAHVTQERPAMFRIGVHKTRDRKQFKRTNQDSIVSESLNPGYLPNQEWVIESLSSFIESVDNNGKEINRAEFKLTLWRLPKYYVYNLIVPTFVMVITSFLGMFSLSSSTGERVEKVNLGMTTILALAVVMLIVQDTMPITALSYPLINCYFLILIIYVCVALLYTVFIVRVQYWAEHGFPFPIWLLKVTFLYDPSVVKKQKEIRMSMKMLQNENGYQSQDNKTQINVEIQDHYHERALLKDMAVSLRRVIDLLAPRAPPDDELLHLGYRVATRLEIIGFVAFTFLTVITTVIYVMIGYSSRY